jgi:hypothetical protein
MRMPETMALRRRSKEKTITQPCPGVLRAMAFLRRFLANYTIETAHCAK